MVLLIVLLNVKIYEYASFFVFEIRV
jgi:hypothetical protein